MSKNSRVYKIFFGKGNQGLQVASFGLKVDIFIRDIIVYLIFLLATTVIAICMVTPTQFYFTNTLFSVLIEEPLDSESFTSFKTLNNLPDYWLFLENRFVNTVYGEKHPFLEDQSQLDDETNYILGQSILLGSPRIRQLRVRNDSCKIVRDFEKAVHVCHGDYSSSTVCKEPFGPGLGTAWTYSTESETDSQAHTALYSSYDGGGFYQDLGVTIKEAKRKLEYMKDNLWTDQATRVVFLDFVIYNPNEDLFCVIRLVAEVPPMGGVIPSWEFRTAYFNHLESKMDYFLLTCEIAYALLVIYYLLREIAEAFVLKIAYLYCPWNYLDVTIIATSLICVVFFVYKYFSFSYLLSKYMSKPRDYPNFEKLGYWQIQVQYTVAFVAFLSWVKVFQYIRFNHTMAQLSTTLSRCAKDILGFGIMFLVVFLAFALMGCIVFGTDLKEYRTIPQAIITLFRTILADFDFEAMQDAQPIIGPLYFVTFVLFVFFVLTNMFLAIISDTYTQVKDEYQETRKENPNFFKLAGVKIFNKCSDCMRGIGGKFKNNKIKRRVGIQRMRKAGMTKSEVDTALEVHQLDEVDKIDQKMVDDILKSWEKVREDKPKLSNPRNLTTRRVPQNENLKNHRNNEFLEDKIALLEKRLELLEERFSKSSAQPDLDLSSD